MQVVAFARATSISCGCFGSTNTAPIGKESIGLVIGLALIAFAALALHILLSPSEYDRRDTP